MQTLAQDLHELLDIPRTLCTSKISGKTYSKPRKGQEIIAAVVRAMVSALHREEEVSIYGFGKFRVIDSPKISVGTILKSGPNGEIIVSGKRPVAFRKRVQFIPSPNLLAMLNQDNGCVLNAPQKRAMESWEPRNEN